MNKTTLMAVLVLLGVGGYFYAKRQPPLPYALKVFECATHGKQEYDSFEVSGTAFVMPCDEYGKRDSRPTLSQEAGSYMQKIEDIDEVYFEFRKKPDGRFEHSSEISRPADYLSKQKVHYLATARGNEKPFKPLETTPYAGEHFTMTVPTPSAFAPTGSETVFWCRSAEMGNSLSCGGQEKAMRCSGSPIDNKCWTKVRSKNMSWDISIEFSKPPEPDLDMQPEVIEAYELVAAHIIKQE